MKITDPHEARELGSGLSSLDFGLRLRCEISREFASYLGVVWSNRYGRVLCGGTVNPRARCFFMRPVCAFGGDGRMGATDRETEAIALCINMKRGKKC